MKKLICLLFISILFSTQKSYAQTAQLYPAPLGITPSTEYKVFINGKETFVYASPIPAAWCSFEISGTVEIVVETYYRDIKWVDIRPRSAQILPSFKDKTIRFKIDKPQKLSVELNGSLRHPLFIFANAPEKNKPSKADPNVLFFEAGKIHYAGMIEAKNNQTIYIEGGAVVVGVIKAENTKNLRIAGRGIIDGTYNRLFSSDLIKTGDTAQIRQNKSGKYEQFIRLDRCENVSIEGITLFNSTSWQIVPINCKDLNINDIKIISDNPSDDGIDVVHSQKVLIENSFIRTKDDCVVIKAYMKKTKDYGIDSVLVQSPNTYKTYFTHQVQEVDDVITRQCVFWNAAWGNALEIGFELNGAEVKNIQFKDCDIIHVEAGAVLSIHNAGKSLVSNILFENIRIEDARQKLFDVAIFRSRYSEDGTRNPEEAPKMYLHGAWDGVQITPPEKKDYHAQFRGKVQGVTFKNISIIEGLFPFSIFYGFDNEHDVKNIRIQNLKVHGQKIKSLQNAKCYIENTTDLTID